MSSPAVTSGPLAAPAAVVASNNNRSYVSKACLGLARRVYKCSVAVINYVGVSRAVSETRKVLLSKWVVSPVVIVGASLFSAMCIKWLTAATLVGKAVGVLGVTVGVHEVLQHVRSMREALLGTYHHNSPVAAPPAYESALAHAIVASQKDKEKTSPPAATANVSRADGGGEVGQQRQTTLDGYLRVRGTAGEDTDRATTVAAAAAAAASAVPQEGDLGESFRTAQGDRTGLGDTDWEMVGAGASGQKAASEGSSVVDLGDDLGHLNDSDDEHPD